MTRQRAISTRFALATTSPDDIMVEHIGENLELIINDSGEKLIVKNWFWNDSPEYRVESIEFGDGTIWDVHEIKQ